jgi:FkbM family methyltransferase
VLTEAVISALRPIHFRGKLRLLNPIAPKEGVRATCIFGSPMSLDLADEIQRDIYLGTYEPIETQWVRSWLKPGMCVVDAGANIGYFSALAADCVGQHGRVISIEPNPTLHRKLERTMQSAPVERSTVFCGGLSEQSGSLSLYLPKNEDSHNATMIAHSGAGQAVSVPVKTLDECLEDWSIETVHLLKVDVEGHENAVFRGAKKAIGAGRIRAILCEFNDPWLRLSGSSQLDLYKSLVELGFVDLHQKSSFGHPVENRFFVFSR